VSDEAQPTRIETSAIIENREVILVKGFVGFNIIYISPESAEALKKIINIS